MAPNNLALLNVLDDAPLQRYHLTVTVFAGMGLFTDAYDIFSISIVSKILGRLYYYDADIHKPGKLPQNVTNAVVGIALIGTLTGQLFFGYLGDKIGRRKAYGVTLILMAICAICSGLSFGHTAKSVMTTLCFFRFWLGFGIGGDYPLSATIMSEYANKIRRGAFIATVFAMQGVGFIFAGLVSMFLSRIFLNMYPADHLVSQKNYTAQPETDFLWRIVLMLGALPAILTYYWRMKMPETGRYTALIEGNATQAAADMGRVLNIRIQAEQDKLAQFKAANEYPLLSREFFRRHGLHLIGTMSTRFFLDIAFYSQIVIQKDLFAAMNLTQKDIKVDAIREMFETSRAMLVVALLGTFPGYWFTVLFIEMRDRIKIQQVGFIMMSLFMFFIGIKYYYFTYENKWFFATLYGLTFFFANYGPNTTTFILPAELFPTRFRSTCHSLSGAAGKAGAMVGVFWVQNYTSSGHTNKIRRTVIFLAFINMLGFFCTYLLTDTKSRGRSLEEISGEDGSQNGTDQMQLDRR